MRFFWVFSNASGLSTYASRREYNQLSDAGMYGNYWSPKLDKSYPSGACALYIRSGGANTNCDFRRYSYPVRPVRKN